MAGSSGFGEGERGGGAGSGRGGGASLEDAAVAAGSTRQSRIVAGECRRARGRLPQPRGQADKHLESGEPWLGSLGGASVSEGLERATASSVFFFPLRTKGTCVVVQSGACVLM